MSVQRLTQAPQTTMNRRWNPASRFFADLQGTTAVEFGIIAVPFLLILCAIFEAAFLVFNQSNLEYATYEASRQLLTGSLQTSGQSSADQLTSFKSQYLCPKLWGSLSCSNIVVDVRSAQTFTGSNTSYDFMATGATTVFSPGNSCDVVVVRVGYPYRLFFNSFGGMGSGSKMIMATAVFKSEAYGVCPA
jgi:Flp pilus assembly protein TadG